MRLEDMYIGQTVLRPDWVNGKNQLTVYRKTRTVFEFHKNGKFSSTVSDTSATRKHDDFYEVGAKKAPKVPEDAKAPETKTKTKGKDMGQQDLLGEALLPIITGAVDQALTDADFEAVVKAEIAKAMGAIPQKKLTIIDLQGKTKEMKLVHKQFTTLLSIIMAGLPCLLKGEAGT